MNLKELHPFRLHDAVRFHKDLNPKLWWGSKLLPRVRITLLKIAEDFIDYLGIDKLKVKDITISGSNAAYSYTDHSDIDLHIVIDSDNLNPDSVYRELFSTKKNLYNEGRKITVHGIPVECYVQDSKQEHVSLGEYSVKHGKWLKFPTRTRSNFNEKATRIKYEKLRGVVERAIKTQDSRLIDSLLKKIKQYRSAGLAKAGEFGPENLAYKAIKAQGAIDKLYKLKDRLRGRDLSIESQYVGESFQTDNDDKLYNSFRKIMRESQFDYSDIPTKKQYYSDRNVKREFDQRVLRHCWGSSGVEKWTDIISRVKSSWGEKITESSAVTPVDIRNFIEHRFRPLKTSSLKPGMTGDIVTVEHKVDNIIGIHVSENKTIKQIMRSKDGGVLILTTDEEIFPINWEVFGYNIDAYFMAQNAGQIITWIQLETDRVNGYRSCDGFMIDLPDEGPYDRIMSKLKEDIISESRLSEYADKVKTPRQFPELPTLDQLKEKNSNHWWKFRDNLSEYLGQYDLNKFEARIAEQCMTSILTGEKIYESTHNTGPSLFEFLKRIENISISPSEIKIGHTVGIVRVSKINQFRLLKIEVLPNASVVFIGDSELIYRDDSGKLRAIELQHMNDLTLARGVYIVSDLEMIDRLHTDLFFYEKRISDEGWKIQVTNSLYENLEDRVVSLHEVSGYIPSYRERNDPRFKTALTVDVTPNSIKDNARKLGSKISRSGRPPLLRK